MGTKDKPGKFDCYDKAEGDEPMFVLLGRDKHAPTLVWLWTVLRELDGEDPEKLAEARGCAVAMIEWLHAHNEKSVGLGHAALAGVMELIRSANYAGNLAKSQANEATDLEIARAFFTHTEIDLSDP